MAAEVGKLFVGGMSWQTTEDTMSSYFSRFGEVEECIVMKDRNTGNPRGFGFIKFKDPECVDQVLSAKPHVLDDKAVDVKPCAPKDVQQKRNQEDAEFTSSHKIFIGGLPRDITEGEVKAFFSSFGSISDVSFAISKDDGKNKGFGFITFDDPSAAAAVVDQHYHDLNGKKVEAKSAQTREQIRRQGGGKFQNGNGYGSGGYGGYDGGYGQQGGYGAGYGAGAYGMQAPYGGGYAGAAQGGYDTGYGTYGGYGQPGSGSGYGGYGSGGGYGQMGNYYQQHAGGPARGGANQRSGGGYHPYSK